MIGTGFGIGTQGTNPSPLALLGGSPYGQNFVTPLFPYSQQNVQPLQQIFQLLQVVPQQLQILHQLAYVQHQQLQQIQQLLQIVPHQLQQLQQLVQPTGGQLGWFAGQQAQPGFGLQSPLAQGFGLQTGHVM